jgi:RimJ/RimL family protein N-acetyltransferase
MRKVLVLKETQKSDCLFLYELLSERKSYENISHKKNPTYAKHVKFVMSKPYTKWYIIYHGKEKIGSIYLSKNDEIGIFVSKEFQGKNIRKLALSELMKRNPRQRYLANVNPKNKKSLKFFKDNGFELVQYTFEKI